MLPSRLLLETTIQRKPEYLYGYIYILKIYFCLFIYLFLISQAAVSRVHQMFMQKAECFC